VLKSTFIKEKWIYHIQFILLSFYLYRHVVIIVQRKDGEGFYMY